MTPQPADECMDAFEDIVGRPNTSAILVHWDIKGFHYVSVALLDREEAEREELDIAKLPETCVDDLYWDPFAGLSKGLTAKGKTLFSACENLQTRLEEYEV